MKNNKEATTNSALLPVYLWIISYLKAYGWKVALLTITIIIIKSCEVAIPKFIQVFIDQIVGEKDFEGFIYILIGVFAAIVIMLAMTMVNTIVKRVIQEKATRDLQYSMLDQLMNLGFPYFEGHPVGETFALLNNNVDSIQGIYREHFPNTINLLFTTLLPFLMILSSKNFGLSIIIIACYLAYCITSPLLKGWVDVITHQYANEERGLYKTIYDGISATAELRAYGAEKWDMGRIIDRYRRFKKTAFTFLVRINTRWLTTRSISSLGILSFFIIGSVMVKNNSLTVGNFVAFSFYYIMALRALVDIGILFTQQNTILNQAVKLYKFMKLKPHVVEIDNPKQISNYEGDLTLKNIRFGYVDGVDILKGFSLKIKSGDRIALLGKSGIGKSTILKLIGRFYDPLEGEIFYDGISYDKLSLSAIRGLTGYVFQETYLFGISIKENIRFGNPEASDEEVIEAAKCAYAHEFIMESQDKYDTIVGERGIKLSGGQKQRISIARMLLKNPKILLLDEATSALDYLCEQEVVNSLGRLMENRTIIAVAHRLSTVKDYDRIIVIADGKVLEEGNYETLMKKQSSFYSLVKGGS